MERYSTVCEEGIDLLMDIFYAKIRADKNGVGDIFNNKIGTSDERWEVHKKKIGEFWRGVFFEKNFSQRDTSGTAEIAEGMV